ncbi:MAG: hypothetical protein ACRYGP_11215 [Janthinobacterium lividum]
MTTTSKSRRNFTEAAREAAALARQRKRDLRLQFPDDHEFAMVVVRAAQTPTGFGWQIRRFGHLQPVAESSSFFKDPADAGRSGEIALAQFKDNRSE